ncbi:MAG: response regulator [Acidobacteria bacterium]|nr:response regulator [Acidobacteriota bacterium]
MYKPGNVVPESGIYVVTHKQHRPKHHNLLLKGQKFPRCRTCGEAVRFQPLRVAATLPAGDERTEAALLLVDDEPGISSTLKQILEREGYAVTTAGTYSAALALLKRNNFDAVITELDLERNQAGLELARRIRTLDAHPEIIISAAEPTPEKLKAAMALHVDYLLFKPIDLNELKLALSRILARRYVERQLVPVL